MSPDLGMGWEVIGGRISLWPVLVRVATVIVVLVTSQLAQLSRREHLHKTNSHRLMHIDIGYILFKFVS